MSNGYLSWRMISSIAILLVSASVAGASYCDLGASDLLFVIKASHNMDNEEFMNIKEFMKRFSATLDFGRDKDNTHIGVILFDNIHDPFNKIELSAYARYTDLIIAIENLKKIPCGTAWCKEKYNGNRKAVDFALQQFKTKNRMSKIVIISSSPSTDDHSYFQNLEAENAYLQILEIMIGQQNIMTYENPYYNYYRSYNDPYKRYMSRYSQLYPNSSFPQPSVVSVPNYGNQYHDGRITLSESLEILKQKDSVCEQIFSCPPCDGHNTHAQLLQIDNNPDSPFNKVLPGDFESQSEFSTDSKNSLKSKTSEVLPDDYEYEIVADPPGMKINPNPAKDDTLITRTTTFSPEYEYEEEGEPTSSSASPMPLPNSSNSFKKRSKRQTRSQRRRQSDCSCNVQNQELMRQPMAISPSYGPQYYSSRYSYYPYQYSSCPYYPCPYSAPQYQQRQPQHNPCSSRFYGYGCPYSRNGYATAYQQHQNNYMPISYQSNRPEYISQQVFEMHSNDAKEEQVHRTQLINDGASPSIKKSEEVVEEESEEEYQLRTLRDVAEENEMRRIPSVSSALPDPLKPRAVSLNNLLLTPPNPNIFLTNGVRSRSEKRFENPELLSKTSVKTRSRIVKKPDAGSSLTDIEENMKKRHKRSLGFFAHTWPSQPNYGMHMATWLPMQHQPARVHSVTTYTPTSDQMNCTIRGSDIVIFIDDVNSMNSYIFESVKGIVRRLNGMLEDNTNKCNHVSRISVLKTLPSGMISTILHLESTRTKAENDEILYNMQPGSCDLNTSPRCDMALPDAIVMGTNMLTMENTDRIRNLIIISSRDAKDITRISKSINQGQEYVNKNSVRTIYVSTSNTSKGVFSPAIRLTSLLSTTCSLSPSPETLREKKQFCPWSPI